MLNCNKSIIDLEEIIQNRSENNYEKSNNIYYEKIIYYLIDFIDSNNYSFLELKNKYFTKLQHKFQRQYKIQVSKPILNLTYNKMIQQKKIKVHNLLSTILMKKQANDISGINQIKFIINLRS